MSLLPPSKFFPPVEQADADGLLFVGGDLTGAWLLDAYRHGIFPWPIFEDPELMAWWSPNPRAVFDVARFHVPKRLWPTIRNRRFLVTCDLDFNGVITGCATAWGRSGNTWLTPELIAAYERLHKVGIAHSVEVWQSGRLVGGTYGVALGGLFTAESMFFRVTDASKVALVHLHRHLAARGYLLWDIQQLTTHTARFGAVELPREEYLRRLDRALQSPVTFGDELQWSDLNGN